MKYEGKPQCKQCPFRPEARPGWLGSYDANSVFSSIWKGVPFFCHTKIDYRDERWLEKAMNPRGGHLCVGGLAFANKIGAPQSEHQPIVIAREKVKLVDGIECMNGREFMQRHRDSPEAQAWISSMEEANDRMEHMRSKARNGITNEET